MCPQSLVIHNLPETGVEVDIFLISGPNLNIIGSGEAESNPLNTEDNDTENDGEKISSFHVVPASDSHFWNTWSYCGGEKFGFPDAIHAWRRLGPHFDIRHSSRTDQKFALPISKRLTVENHKPKRLMSNR